MRRSAIIFSLLGAYFGLERLLRHGGAASSLREAETDAGSTQAIAQAFGIGLAALSTGPLLSRWRATTLPRRDSLFRFGVTAMIVGLIVRAWATSVLGASYTRTLRVSAEQRIVEDGPYRMVRHPGYLGTLLVWLGAATALANWLVLGVVGTVMLRAYTRRMEAEERMLLSVFGDGYRGYMDRTRRLIPFLY